MPKAKASHLLVGNPTAQSGRNAERIERARAFFKQRKVGCDFLATEPGGRTISAVTAAVDKGKHVAVVAMGGDRTFREHLAHEPATGRIRVVDVGGVALPIRFPMIERGDARHDPPLAHSPHCRRSARYGGRPASRIRCMAAGMS